MHLQAAFRHEPEHRHMVVVQYDPCRSLLFYVRQEQWDFLCVTVGDDPMLLSAVPCSAHPSELSPTCRSIYICSRVNVQHHIIKECMLAHSPEARATSQPACFLIDSGGQLKATLPCSAPLTSSSTLYSCPFVRPPVVAPPAVWFCIWPGAGPCACSWFAHVRPCAQGRCGRCPPGSGVMSDLFLLGSIPMLT